MRTIKQISQQIKELYRKLSDPYWRARYRYIHYYDKLPLDEKAILLESEHGKKLNGNIYYILRYLARSERYKEYKIYVTCRAREIKRFNEFLSAHNIFDVQVVVFLSDQYVRLLASAK